jgi:hypothetical protein
LQRQTRQAGDATQVSVNFNMNSSPHFSSWTYNLGFDIFLDIRSACIVLTIFASFLALVSLVFSIALAYDWIRYLMRPKGHRGIVEKEHPDDAARPPFSTRTLNWQTILLSFLSLWMLAILIPSTVLSRVGVGRIEVNNGQLPGTFFIDTRYWDYGFCRSLRYSLSLIVELNGFSSALCGCRTLVQFYLLRPCERCQLVCLAFHAD